MSRGLRAVFLARLLAGCANWSHANTAMELAFATEQAVDLKQTSEAVAYCGEANGVIGACGEHVSPQAYFLTTTLIHAFVSAALPRGWREVWQGATILSQGWNIYGNVSAIDANRAAHCADRVGTMNPCPFTK